MKRLTFLAAAAGLCVAGPSWAYEYPLLFSPAPSARGDTVAGYALKGASVVGVCSYHVTSCSGGRGGRCFTTHFNQTCTWDSHGVLRGFVSGAPTAPSPLSTANGLTVYARDAKGDTTGYDATRGTGFVNTIGAQYTVSTPSGGYLFLTNQTPVTIGLSIKSVGEIPLRVTKILATASARVTVKSTTCAPANVPVGASCAIVLTYDPSSIPGGDDPYTLYDHLSVSLISNSGLPETFTESIEAPIAPAG